MLSKKKELNLKDIDVFGRKKINMNTYTLCLIVLITFVVGYISHIEPPNDCRGYARSLDYCQAENIVCSGGFQEGLETLLFDWRNEIIFAILLSWVLHGMGFRIIG